MTMDLETALRLVDGIQATFATLAAAGSSQSDLLRKNTEALGVVLTAARARHLVEESAAKDPRRHLFAPDRTRPSGVCACGLAAQDHRTRVVPELP